MLKSISRGDIFIAVNMLWLVAISNKRINKEVMQLHRDTIVGHEERFLLS